MKFSTFLSIALISIFVCTTAFGMDQNAGPEGVPNFGGQGFHLDGRQVAPAQAVPAAPQLRQAAPNNNAQANNNNAHQEANSSSFKDYLATLGTGVLLGFIGFKSQSILLTFIASCWADECVKESHRRPMYLIGLATYYGLRSIPKE